MKAKQFEKGKNFGFTLIELLVVVAIIGVLASVVLVSLNSARDKARYARVISDLKQIALAAELDFNIYGNYALDAYPSENPRFVSDGEIMTHWPDPPCSNWVYDWDNWTNDPASQNTVRVTIRNTNDPNTTTNSIFFYCIQSDGD